ncbi:MAG: HEPN domain-containing protein [Chitinophagaceae bacterium]|nr:MAG: HEPN domain-containing protein [Chitinophagaceae bacterium]
MRPFTIYQAAFDSFQHTGRMIVDLIGELVEVDRIYLLGGSLYRRRTESMFNQLAPSLQYVADCYCLILLPDTNTARLVQLQDQIEQHCTKILPMTAIVLSTKQFDSWLQDGHSFALRVHTCAPLLLQKDTGYQGTLGTIDEVAELKRLEMTHKEGLKRVDAFLAGAELFCLRKENRMAAFMLHQAAEQALSTLLKITTGYYCCTHNIERLLRYTGMVTHRVNEIFPKNNEPEKRLVSLLQKAYIDSRYREDYTMPEADVRDLLGRVGELRKILIESAEASLPKL